MTAPSILIHIRPSHYFKAVTWLIASDALLSFGANRSITWADVINGDLNRLHRTLISRIILYRSMIIRLQDKHLCKVNDNHMQFSVCGKISFVQLVNKCWSKLIRLCYTDNCNNMSKTCQKKPYYNNII